MELKYPIFDGEKIWESACVTIENGIITSVTECDLQSCDNHYFLMPGLIDAHTHMGTKEQVKELLENGIVATCDVSASHELIENSKELKIVGSGGMAMGVVISGKSFVDRAIENGAKYIKVLLFNAFSIGKPALCSIVKAAHEKGLKVAVHATEITTVKQAVEAGADILLHVPMQEPFPVSLVKKITAKGIVVVPTLIMMETFTNSGRNGYKPSDYVNAKEAVKLLHESGVTILTGTDANNGSFAPAVSYGDSMHREMELLSEAGLSPIEVLKSATRNVADVFGITDIGRIEVGKRANLILVEGRPDKVTTDIKKIKQIWVDGNPLLYNTK